MQQIVDEFEAIALVRPWTRADRQSARDAQGCALILNYGFRLTPVIRLLGLLAPKQSWHERVGGQQCGDQSARQRRPRYLA
jgi:hypothetical protein